MVSGVREALQTLWAGLCTVIVRESHRNPDNKQTEYTEVVLHEDVPCHLSLTRVTEAGEQDNAATIQQAAKLFLGPEIEIPTGSKIEVAQHGVATAYARSGKPAVYPSHQEIALVPFERWA